MKTDAIIQAAGLSNRMGRNKLRLPYRDKPILQHTIDLVESLPFASVHLVTRQETIAGMQVPEHFHVIFNLEPERGQSSSMKLGLASAAGDGYLFFQADQPLLDRATVMAVLVEAGPDRIVVPEYAGVPGNPVFFAARFKEELMAVTGDQGGRSVRDAHPECCHRVLVDSPGPLWDVDTQEKYHVLLRGDFDI